MVEPRRRLRLPRSPSPLLTVGHQSQQSTLGTNLKTPLSTQCHRAPQVGRTWVHSRAHSWSTPGPEDVTIVGWHTESNQSMSASCYIIIATGPELWALLIPTHKVAFHIPISRKLRFGEAGKPYRFIQLLTGPAGTRAWDPTPGVTIW